MIEGFKGFLLILLVGIVFIFYWVFLAIGSLFIFSSTLIEIIKNKLPELGEIWKR